MLFYTDSIAPVFLIWWERVGLNHCRGDPTDLQSAAFDRSATLPNGGT